MISDSQLTRLGLFDARVPRYTSYPTAPHFSDSVTPGVFNDWVSNIVPGSQISLYLHVPFCRRLCWFCACRTQGTSTDAPVQAYVQVLQEEIRLLRDQLPEGVTLSRLHWGGGTPTLLSPDLIRTLAGTIFDAVPMGEGAEFSVEIDPNEVDGARLDALAEAGMNRASIGVQDFDPEIQGIIGRDQSYDITRDAVEALRSRGIASLNADILYGLPNQTTQRISSTVQKLLSLSPDRVALYGYAHVPWMARRQQMIPSDTLPTPEERLRLFDTARRLFAWDGYLDVGIDHFARKTDGLGIAVLNNTLRRNFQGYTDDTAPVLVGLGASSISYFPEGYAQNVSGTSDYTKAVRAGSFATHRGHVFAGEDLLRRRMIEQLMCEFRIDSDEMIADFGATRAQLAGMYDTAARRFPGVVSVDDTGFAIPPEGRPLTRMIASAFDEYFGKGKAGHSSAV